MYRNILSTARDYANADPRKPDWLQGDTFRVPQDSSSLALEYEPTEVQGAIIVQKRKGNISSEDEVYDILQQIVVDAVQRAIIQHKEDFALIILENFRSGQDAFAAGTDN